MSNMDISDVQWEVFRLYVQDRLGYKRTAEAVNLPIQRVREMIAELRKAEPALFPCESERMNFGHQHMARNGKKLINWDEVDENVDPVKIKF